MGKGPLLFILMVEDILLADFRQIILFRYQLEIRMLLFHHGFSRSMAEVLLIAFQIISDVKE